MYFWMLNPIFDGDQAEFHSNGYFSALFGTKTGGKTPFKGNLGEKHITNAYNYIVLKENLT